jgi:hypothetical protein
MRRFRHGKDAGPLVRFGVNWCAGVVDKPELAESFSTFRLWASRSAPFVGQFLDDFFHLEGILGTCVGGACRVFRVLEASDNALTRANVLKVVKADFHRFRHLVVEAEVMMALNDREILLACS